MPDTLTPARARALRSGLLLMAALTWSGCGDDTSSRDLCRQVAQDYCDRVTGCESDDLPLEACVVAFTDALECDTIVGTTENLPRCQDDLRQISCETRDFPDACKRAFEEFNDKTDKGLGFRPE